MHMRDIDDDEKKVDDEKNVEAEKNVDDENILCNFLQRTSFVI